MEANDLFVEAREKDVNSNWDEESLSKIPSHVNK